jgi:hypothetical protein
MVHRARAKHLSDRAAFAQAPKRMLKLSVIAEVRN